MADEHNPPVVLSVAGFDPGSGAGVTADIKTAVANNCFGISCITAITVQSTQGVKAVEALRPELVEDTLKALTSDFNIAAVKIGMMGSAGVATTVADWLEGRMAPNIKVLDPILFASSGVDLAGEGSLAVLRERLLGLTTLITPNVKEAETLSGVEIRNQKSAIEAGQRLRDSGAKNVVITGGDLPDNADLLLLESGEVIWIPGEKIESPSVHGTGCAFSTAIACNLALGHELPEAVRLAKDYVRNAILTAAPLGLGRHKPMNLQIKPK